MCYNYCKSLTVVMFLALVGITMGLGRDNDGITCLRMTKHSHNNALKKMVDGGESHDIHDDMAIAY